MRKNFKEVMAYNTTNANESTDNTITNKLS